MKKVLVSAALALVFIPFIAGAAEENSAKAKELADAVWKTSGGENWSKVKSIDFTFNVEKDGKTVASAEHHWDVAAQTDQVKWKGKEVTVNLADPASSEDDKAAYARWVNDSYWLLAPLKLKDHGVNLTDEGKKEMNGVERETLLLSFGEVGLTPKDNYRLYINPETKLVESWDYMPEPGTSKHATWTAYEKSGGLTLATDHQMDGGIRIQIKNLKVNTRQ
ncbi:MAG: hypothetical protein ACR2G0_02115 [Chthoniobacterales bacterium]